MKYEQMMNIVRRKRGKEGRRKEVFIVSVGRRTYVPSTSESKRGWRKKWVVGIRRGRWAKGRKRQDEERKEARSDSGRNKGIKRRKKTGKTYLARNYNVEMQGTGLAHYKCQSEPYIIFFSCFPYYLHITVSISGHLHYTFFLF